MVTPAKVNLLNMSIYTTVVTQEICATTEYEPLQPSLHNLTNVRLIFSN